MQFRQHALVVASFGRDQKQVRVRGNDHAHPVGQLLLKSDIDATRNMPAAKGFGIAGIDDHGPAGHGLLELRHTEGPVQGAGFQQVGPARVGGDDVAEALRPRGQGSENRGAEAFEGRMLEHGVGFALVTQGGAALGAHALAAQGTLAVGREHFEMAGIVP